MFTRILLLISLFFNVVLYYGFLDLGQFRNYVDSTIDLSKKFAKSDEFQDFKDNTVDLSKQIIDKSNVTDNVNTDTIKNVIK